MNTKRNQLTLALIGLTSCCVALPADCATDQSPPPLHLSLDAATQKAISMEYQKADQSSSNYTSLNDATNHCQFAEKYLTDYANAKVKNVLFDSIDSRFRSAFSFQLIPYPIAMGGADATRNLNAALNMSKVAVNASNSYSYSFYMTNGNPVAFLAQFTLKRVELLRLLKEPMSGNNMFFRLPREVDYFPEFRDRLTWNVGGGATIDKYGGNLESSSAGSGIYSKYFEERSDDDYFGFVFFKVDLSRLNKLVPLNYTMKLKSHWLPWAWDVRAQTPAMKYVEKDHQLTIGDAFAFLKIETSGECASNYTDAIPVDKTSAFYAVVPIAATFSKGLTNLPASVFVYVGNEKLTMCLPTRKGAEKRSREILRDIKDDSLFNLNINPIKTSIPNQ